METLPKLWLPLTITITILLITTLLKLKARSTKSTPLLPSPPHNLPIVGHLHYLLTQPMPHHALAKLAETLGPIFRLQLGRVNTVVVSSGHYAQLILKAHDHVFSDRPQLLAPRILSFGCSDVTFSNGPYWRQVRKICVNELLSARRVAAFHRIRADEVNRLVENLISRSGTDVDLSGKLFELSNNLLCRVAFGRRFCEGEGSRSDMVGVFTETQALLGGFCAGDFFPGWEWVNVVSGMKRRLLRNLKDLRKVCDEIIAEHLRSGSGSGDGDEDLVDVLIRVQKREDLQVEITDDNLKAIVLDMFVAGTDTTVASLEWIMTELVKHPAVLTRAQEEVRGVVSTGGQVSLNHLQTLDFMKCIIKETMRLHPPVPLLVPRESMEDCTLDGFFIPKKTRILVNAYAIGRNLESWANPLEFDPCRFLNTNIELKDQDFRFVPFGGGRRGCPGYAFGLATVELTLANLLYNFNWTLPNNVSIDAIDLDENFGLSTRKKNPLILVPTLNSQ